MDFNFTVTTTEGYTYRPFTNGHAVGFHVTAPNGTCEILFINPSGETDDGYASATFYQGTTGPDINAIASDDDTLYGVTARWHTDLFDIPTTAHALAVNDLKTMAIGPEPTDVEIALRAAEHAAELIRKYKEDEVTAPINLNRVVAWLKLYGVPAYVEQTGGGCATIYAGDRNVDRYGDGDLYHALAIGPGWFEGPNWTEARADTTDLYIGPHDQGEGDAVSTHAGMTELEIAWLAVNMLTGAPLWQPGHPQWTPAKATPTTAPHDERLSAVIAATTAAYPDAKAVHLEPASYLEAGHILNDVTLADGALLTDTDNTGFWALYETLLPITVAMQDISPSVHVHVSQYGAVDIELTTT